MAYTKTTWVNDSAPYLNATNLNKLEQGVEDAHTTADAAAPAAAAVPTGGAAGDVLAKASGTDYAVAWADVSAKYVPTGGTTGQVLVKASNTDNDVAWGATPTPYVAVSKWVGSGGVGAYEARPAVLSSGFVIFDASLDDLAPPPSSATITGGGSPSARDRWATERTD